jgi:3-oxoacyl-[acyl-carrier protein] reductase
MSSIPLPAALSMQGRRVLVTGAASGIGRATALVLAQLGAELLLADRAPLDAVREEVKAAGGTCSIAQGDLTADAFVAQLVGGTRLHAVAH